MKHKTYKKYLSEDDVSTREKHLDKLGTKKLKPRIDVVIKELKDIERYMNISTDAHLYGKKFRKMIMNFEKFSKNFKPKFEKGKSKLTVLNI